MNDPILRLNDDMLGVIHASDSEFIVISTNGSLRHSKDSKLECDTILDPRVL